jgi:hypothetical protein
VPLDATGPLQGFRQKSGGLGGKLVPYQQGEEPVGTHRLNAAGGFGMASERSEVARCCGGIRLIVRMRENERE